MPYISSTTSMDHCWFLPRLSSKQINQEYTPTKAITRTHILKCLGLFQEGLIGSMNVRGLWHIWMFGRKKPNRLGRSTKGKFKNRTQLTSLMSYKTDLACCTIILSAPFMFYWTNIMLTGLCSGTLQKLARPTGTYLRMPGREGRSLNVLSNPFIPLTVHLQGLVNI